MALPKDNVCMGDVIESGRVELRLDDVLDRCASSLATALATTVASPGSACPASRAARWTASSTRPISKAARRPSRRRTSVGHRFAVILLQRSRGSPRRTAGASRSPRDVSQPSKAGVPIGGACPRNTVPTCEMRPRPRTAAYGSAARVDFRPPTISGLRVFIPALRSPHISAGERSP